MTTSQAVDAAVKCRHCSAPMRLVVSGRYWHCISCARLGAWIYCDAQTGDATTHPLHGARIAAPTVATNQPQPRPATMLAAGRHPQQGARR